jgi:heme/copper-type cytochrome/quinol oxidase subunit 2
MPGSGAMLLAAALLSLSLAGCTSGPSTPSAAPGSSSASAASSLSASSPNASQPNAQVTIDITIADGQVTPNGRKIDVEVGQQVVLNVTSDEHDEIHAHTGGDGYELEVAPGKKVTGSFTLTSPGSFEVESHHLEKVIVILNAR